MNILKRQVTAFGLSGSKAAPFSTGYKCPEPERMVSVADEYINSIRCAGLERSELGKSYGSNATDVLISLEPGSVIPVENAMGELAARYGPHIHIARNGWYVFHIVSPPRETVQIQDRNFRIRSYVPGPCTFWMSAGHEIDGHGALLVPQSQAIRFWKEARTIDIKGILVAAYIWYFGRKYRMFGISETELGTGSSRIDSVESYVVRYHPDIMMLNRNHLLDRDRKAR